MTKHVLVTGGAGFIASHIADAYIERGWRVTIIDNLTTGNRRNLNPRAEFHEMDIRDDAAAALIRELKPDVVNHHAAQIDVRKSVADPADDAAVNVVASVRLLQACVDAGVKRFLFASTGGAIYGEPVFAPQTEEHPREPLSPYGCAKLSVEHYMNYFREVHGLSTVALRYANVYGPRQNSKGEAGVVAIFIDRLLRNETAVINGTGEQTRDFVYVADLVAANMAVSEDASLTGAFNVGTGLETSINEVYRLLAKAAGTDRPAEHGPAKAGEQMRSVLSNAKLWAAAKLAPPMGLEEGLKRTFDSFR